MTTFTDEIWNETPEGVNLMTTDADEIVGYCIDPKVQVDHEALNVFLAKVGMPPFHLDETDKRQR